jgi:hypothetical protein
MADASLPEHDNERVIWDLERNAEKWEEWAARHPSRRRQKLGLETSGPRSFAVSFA